MKPTIRLKAQQTGETVIEDQVQGRVVWQNETSTTSAAACDGNPTYMLAVVVTTMTWASPTSSAATII
jgi:glutamyl-tRNA synthetase